MSLLHESDEDVEMTKKKLLRGETPSIRDVSPAQKGLRKQLIDTACILLNISSTVTLVFLNKWYACEDAWSGHLLIVRYAQDLQRPPIEEDANLLCNVAFHMHFDRTLDSESSSIQVIRAGPVAISADDTSLQLFCWISHTWKSQLSI
jgi:hypothetical protein